jgi:Protein of unknown function (DUF3461)
MTRYPNLTEMGIHNPEQISSCSLTALRFDRDILRIRYRRPSGSLLPITRSYEFGRIPRPVDPTATAGDGLTQYEIAPILNGALAELDGLVRAHETQAAVVAALTEQVDELEEDFTAGIAGIKARLTELQSTDGGPSGGRK